MQLKKVKRTSEAMVFYVVLALVMGMLAAFPAFCGEKADVVKEKANLKTSAQVSKGAVEKERKKAEHIKEELNKKAVRALADTYKVLDLLEKQKSKEALELLKEVIGELEVILAANKEVSLIPVNTYTIVVDTPLNPDEISKKIAQVERMLKQGDVQGARLLLDTLQSEIDIVIENLPLATYPDAMKLASKYIVDGKLSEARSVLSIALNSMVVKKIVVPIPLVRAADLVEEASKTAKSDREQALRYLDEAQKQLRMARVLGYGKDEPEVYKDLQARIDAIKKEVGGKNKAAQMFEELLEKLRQFKDRLVSS